MSSTAPQLAQSSVVLGFSLEYTVVTVLVQTKIIWFRVAQFQSEQFISSPYHFSFRLVRTIVLQIRVLVKTDLVLVYSDHLVF